LFSDVFVVQSVFVLFVVIWVNNEMYLSVEVLSVKQIGPKMNSEAMTFVAVSKTKEILNFYCCEHTKITHDSKHKSIVKSSWANFSPFKLKQRDLGGLDAHKVVDEGGLQETCAFFLSLKNEINQSKF
jgi:CRISPR/Cas system CMR-associated protein Cmr5 small subunit